MPDKTTKADVISFDVSKLDEKQIEALNNALVRGLVLEAQKNPSLVDVVAPNAHWVEGGWKRGGDWAKGGWNNGGKDKFDIKDVEMFRAKIGLVDIHKLEDGGRLSPVAEPIRFRGFDPTR